MPVEGKEARFPSQFGRYTLVERLATGGMAEVFKAKILSTHGFEKLLVIKRILPNLAADKTFVSMFIDEAKLTAQLIHPKIVQVTDFGEERGQYFIALEFVDGFDGLGLLRSAAQKHVRLPIPICMWIAAEVLDALDYAHNAKDGEGKPMHLVHRDISPSNVFIARRGDVKLGDFGIAHAQERESKTQAGTLKGKYGYMSPEQVTGAELDGRSDIFAVGIVLAEMLMGKRLFTAPNDLDVLLMVRDGRLERWDKHGKDVPESLDAIVRKALAKSLDERYQTAAEFRDALEDLQFQFGMRVGPADLGALVADLFEDQVRQAVRRDDLRPGVDEGEARVQAGVEPQAPLDQVVHVRHPAENLRIGLELDQRAVGDPGALAGELLDDFAAFEPRACILPVAVRLDEERQRQGVDGLGADAIEADRELEDVVVVLRAGVDARDALHHLAQGNAAAVVAHGHLAAGDRDLDALAEAHDELVHGVVHNLLQEDVDAVVILGAVAHAADVHARALADVLQRRQRLDLAFVVVVDGLGHGGKPTRA